MIVCNYGLGNSGIACTPLFKVLKKLVFVPYYDSLGAQNRITLAGGPFNSAFFSALVNQADISKRWYPTPFLKNASNRRGESITQSFDDQSRIIVEQGTRKIVAIIVGKDASPQLVGQLKTIRNVEVGFYGIDKDDNLVGMLNDPLYLDPIRLDPNSFDPIFNPGDDKQIQEIMINADIHADELDENLRMLASSELAYSVSLLQGLLDVSPTYSSPLAAGSLKLKLTTKMGTALNPLPVNGLVANDFTSSVTGAVGKMRNITAGADVTITGCTEGTDSNGDPNGEYTLTFAVQTVGHVMKNKPVKNGFDFKLVTAATTTLT